MISKDVFYKHMHDMKRVILRWAVRTNKGKKGLEWSREGDVGRGGKGWKID